MENLRNPKCFDCTHYLDYGKCKAFPDSIPTTIFVNDSHHQIFEGQTGTFIYESKNQSKDLK
ncbi:MAG: hypothetical protein WCG93_13175 [Paludibacter sp.]